MKTTEPPPSYLCWESVRLLSERPRVQTPTVPVTKVSKNSSKIVLLVAPFVWVRSKQTLFQFKRFHLWALVGDVKLLAMPPSFHE